MIELPNVSLVVIDNLNPDRVRVAIDACTSAVNFGEVLHLVPPIHSKEDYSRFVLQELPGIVSLDFVMIAQWDGYIINPSAWVPEFLDYDYIGAPWWFMHYNNVGNGGFSLRSRRMLEACKVIHPYHPEDGMIRLWRPELESKGIRFAPEELAARFSFERNDKYQRYDGSFGFHGPKPI